jgi:hypothetical protein
MKKILLLMLLSLGGFLIVVFLFYFSQRDLHRKNGFSRNFNNAALKQMDEIDLKFANYYLSGMTNNSVFLGNHKATLHGLMLSADFKDTLHFNAGNIFKDTAVTVASIKVQVDSPNVYYLERMTPSYFQSFLPTNDPKRIDLGDVKFDRVKVISKNSLVIRLYQSGKRVLQKIIVHPLFQKSTVYPLSDERNGSFGIDGFMAYNKAKGRLFYTHFYSNQIICLDTNLNLIYRAQTIDTNTIAKVKVAEISHKKTKEKLMSAPPLQVNRKGYTDGNWFYVQSLLAADNESFAEFKTYAVIDVYRVDSGKYHHSFKVPNYKGQQLNDFAVFGHRLCALYGQYLVSYEIP